MIHIYLKREKNNDNVNIGLETPIKAILTQTRDEKSSLTGLICLLLATGIYVKHESIILHS